LRLQELKIGIPVLSSKMKELDIFEIEMPEGIPLHKATAAIISLNILE
jgi:phosphoribosylcarboxyaminoimidazole (NCAIR) mutase